MPSTCETSTSLIQRLGQHEPKAWDDFATKYTWMMRRWLRSWGIPTQDAEDILQDSCLRVFRNIHRFEHQGTGSFRAWLKKVSRSCWLQVIRKSAYRARAEQSELDLSRFIAEETLVSIDHQIDLLIEHELFDFALDRTRRYFSESTWNAYRLTVLEGCSGACVAEQLGMSIDAVYKNKERFEVGLHHELQAVREFE
jgi:RNA polymerase sigma-70 factor (ECF subfamily)